VNRILDFNSGILKQLLKVLAMAASIGESRFEIRSSNSETNSESEVRDGNGPVKYFLRAH